LGQHLQDQRCRDLAAELLMGDLIDRKTGKWSYFVSFGLQYFTGWSVALPALG
jgi:hypothetical protein